jgi:two-component system response regulator PilR (NtrC family)
MSFTRADGNATPRLRVLVVEDDELAQAVVQEAMAEAGYNVDAVGSGEEALRLLERELYDVVLLDLHLPRMQGLSVLAAATTLQTDAQFVLMTAFGTVDTAVEAMKLGAYDYITKPFGVAELLLTVERACRETELRREVAQLRRRTGSDPRSRIVGRSAVINRMFDLIERVAPMRATVLISGETGTGKELVARAIHDLSGRARRPFVAVNCSALPETLLESELFGHVKGSFTGAIATKRGLFEEAAGGTLFLDEMSTISAHIQVKLLRVLEERTIQRVGSTQRVAVDFRLIAATNEDLATRVAAGDFREDLYYRLNVFPVTVPPLRERADDIPLLANHFRLRFAQENELEPPNIPPVTLARMAAYDWPGNVRELENFIERAVILYAGAREIHFDSPGNGRREEQELVRRAAVHDWDLERLEHEYIMAILERTGGHQGRASEILGIDRRTLYRKLHTMGLQARTGESVPA